MNAYLYTPAEMDIVVRAGELLRANTGRELYPALIEASRSVDSFGHYAQRWDACKDDAEAEAVGDELFMHVLPAIIERSEHALEGH